MQSEDETAAEGLVRIYIAVGEMYTERNRQLLQGLIEFEDKTRLLSEVVAGNVWVIKVNDRVVYSLERGDGWPDIDVQKREISKEYEKWPHIRTMHDVMKQQQLEVDNSKSKLSSPGAVVTPSHFTREENSKSPTLEQIVNEQRGLVTIDGEDFYDVPEESEESKYIPKNTNTHVPEHFAQSVSPPASYEELQNNAAYVSSVSLEPNDQFYEYVQNKDDKDVEAFLREYHTIEQINENLKRNAQVSETGLLGNFGNMNVELKEERQDVRADVKSVINEAILDTADAFPNSNLHSVATDAAKTLVVKRKAKKVTSIRRMGAQQEDFEAMQMLRPVVESPCIHCCALQLFFTMLFITLVILYVYFPKFILFNLSELPMQIERTNDFVRGWNLGQSQNDGFVKTVGFEGDSNFRQSKQHEVLSLYEDIIPESERGSVYTSLKQEFTTMNVHSVNLVGPVDRATHSSQSGGYFRALGKEAARKYSEIRLDHLSDVILTRSLASKEIVVLYQPHDGDAQNIHTLHKINSYESEMRANELFQRHCLLDWSAVIDGGIILKLDGTELEDSDGNPVRGAQMNQRVAAEAATQVLFDNTAAEAKHTLEQAYKNLSEYNAKFQRGEFPQVKCVWPTSVLRPSETVASTAIINNSTHTCAERQCRPLGLLTKEGHLSETVKNERLLMYSALRIPQTNEVLTPSQQVLSTFVPEWFDIVDSSFGSGSVRSNALRSKFHFGLPLQGYNNVATRGEEQAGYLDSYVGTSFIPELLKWASRVQGHMVMTFESVDSGVLSDLFHSEISKSRLLLGGSVALAGVLLSLAQQSCCLGGFAVYLGLIALCVTYCMYRLFGYSYIGLYHLLTALVVMFICIDYVIYYYAEWDQAERLHAPISIQSKSGRIKESTIASTRQGNLDDDDEEEEEIHASGGLFGNLRLIQEDVIKQLRLSSWNTDESKYMIYWTLRRQSFTVRTVALTTFPALICMSIAISVSGSFSMPALRSFAVFTVMAPLGVQLVLSCGLPCLAVCHRKHLRHRRCCMVCVKEKPSLDLFQIQASAAGRLTRAERFFHLAATRFVIKYKYLCMLLTSIIVALFVYLLVDGLSIDRSDMSSAMFVSDHPINKYNDVREHFRQGDTIRVNFVFGLDSKNPIDRSEVDPLDKREVGKALFTNVYVNAEGSFDMFRSRYCILSLCDFLSIPNDYLRLESKTLFNEPKCVLNEMSQWQEKGDLSRFSGINNIPNGLYNNTLTEDQFWISFYVFMAFEHEFCSKNGASFSCAEKFNQNVVFHVNNDVTRENIAQLLTVQVKLLVIEAKLSQNRNIEYEDGIAFFNVWETFTNEILGNNSPSRGCRSLSGALPSSDATLAQLQEYAPWYHFKSSASPIFNAANISPRALMLPTENYYSRRNNTLKHQGKPLRSFTTYQGNEYPAKELPLGALSGFQCGGDSVWQPWHIYFFQKLFGEEVARSLGLGFVCLFVWLVLVTGTPIVALLGLQCIILSEVFMVGLVPIFGYNLGIVTVAPVLLYPGYCSIQIYRMMDTYIASKAINPKEKVREMLTKNATSIATANVFIMLCCLMVAISETAAFRNFSLLFLISTIYHLFTTLFVLPSFLLFLGPGGHNGNVYLHILHTQCCWRILNKHAKWKRDRKKYSKLMKRGEEQHDEIVKAQELAAKTVKDVVYDDDVEVQVVLDDQYKNIELRVLYDMNNSELYQQYEEELRKKSMCYPTSCNDRLTYVLSTVQCLNRCRRRQRATMWEMMTIKKWLRDKYDVKSARSIEETHILFEDEVLDKDPEDLDESSSDESSVTVDEFIAEEHTEPEIDLSKNLSGMNDRGDIEMVDLSSIHNNDSKITDKPN